VYEENDFLVPWQHQKQSKYFAAIGHLTIVTILTLKMEQLFFQSFTNVVKQKVSKRPLKFFICLYMNGRVCVCLSVPIIKLNNFWKNERILMKISGPVQLCTRNFWVGVSDQPASRVQPSAKNSVFLENLSPPISPWIFVLQGHDIPFCKPQTYR